MFTASLLILGLTPAVLASIIPRQSSYPTSDNCPGYALSNPLDDGSKFTADLALAGPACNLYGSDLPHLKLEVEYQSGTFQLLKVGFTESL
jgi:alpha-glucosidase